MMENATCQDCHWVGKWSDALSAENPFAPKCFIYGCPQCKEVGMLVTACWEEGCGRAATIGTPTEGRYYWSCHEHEPSHE